MIILKVGECKVLVFWFNIIKSFHRFICPVMSCVMLSPRYRTGLGVVRLKTLAPAFLAAVRSYAIAQSRYSRNAQQV